VAAPPLELPDPELLLELLELPLELLELPPELLELPEPLLPPETPELEPDPLELLPPLQAESRARQSATGNPFGNALRNDMSSLLPSIRTAMRGIHVRRVCRTSDKKLRAWSRRALLRARNIGCPRVGARKRKNGCVIYLGTYTYLIVEPPLTAERRYLLSDITVLVLLAFRLSSLK
jgi:hypothetical protein